MPCDIRTYRFVFTVTFITSAVDDIFSGEQDELESILSSQNNQGQTKDEDDFVVPSGESFSALFVVTDYESRIFYILSGGRRA